MSQIGGQIEELLALKGTFDREASDVERLASSIQGQLGNTWWVGPAADRFRTAWESEFKPALTRLQAALVEAGTEVSRRREALIQAGS